MKRLRVVAKLDWGCLLWTVAYFTAMALGLLLLLKAIL